MPSITKTVVALLVLSSQGYGQQVGKPTTAVAKSSKVQKTKPKTTLAQRKAEIQAARRRLGHVGGGFGGGRAEGVGKGRTRDSAIRHCCYWGRRTPMQIGAAKSANGWWYACVLYR